MTLTFGIFQDASISLLQPYFVSSNHQSTRHNIKYLIKLDIQVDFRDTSNHKKGILIPLNTATGGFVSYRGKNLTNANEQELTEYRRFNVGFVFQFYH